MIMLFQVVVKWLFRGGLESLDVVVFVKIYQIVNKFECSVFLGNFFE